VFDIGFWELGLIFLIGLIVLGPERLPKVARTLGLWARRARGYMQSITSELENEMDVGEMREHFRKTGEYLGQTRDEFKTGVTDLRDSVQSATGQGGGKRDHFRRAQAAKAPPASKSSDDAATEQADDQAKPDALADPSKSGE